MQTFIPKYRGGEEQTQKYLQDISSMIHESQTFNIRDPQKNGWIVSHYSRSFFKA